MFEDYFKKILTAPVDEAHDALKDILVRAEPLLNNLFTRLSYLCHDLLDRVECNIQIRIKPVHARAANPEPNEDQTPS